MVDPLTALSVASAAVGQMRSLVRAGQDCTAAMSKFAGAWADVNEAERRAKNPPWYKSFSGSLEREAANAFAARKKAEKLKKELEGMIQFAYGPSGLKEYKTILRDMREQKRKNEFRRQQLKDSILEWTLGIVLFVVVVAIASGIFYLIGKQQGKW